jgi:hypothetical protein
MNLQEFLRKSKPSTTFLTRKVVLGKELETKANNLVSGKIYTVIIVILVALASYGLGRLSKIEENKVPIRLIENTTAPATAGAVLESQPKIGKYLASKSGAKYHLPWCSGAQRIKEENKIWFETKEDAEKAGYGPAANCKGI